MFILKFCEEPVNANCVFHKMMNVVHFDEKWFCLTEVKHSCYLMLDEEEPERTCKNKHYCTLQRQCFWRYWLGRSGITTGNSDLMESWEFGQLRGTVRTVQGEHSSPKQ